MVSAKMCVLVEGMQCDEAIRIDAELRAIARQRQQLLAREAVLLVRAEELEIWRLFGCVTFLEYLERFCDLQPRTAKDYVRVARALRELPVMRGQLEAQRIVYSTVRELSRIATAETEEEWLLHVAGMSPREIEEEVAGRKKGDTPNDPRDPDRTVKLVLEVRASTYAQFVEVRTRLADDRGERLTDDEVVQALCAADTSANSDAPSHQIAITTCRSCAKNFQLGGGREIEVSVATVERARCDARHLGDLESDARQRTTTTVTPRMRRQVMTRDGYMCRVPGCRSMRFLDVHHIVFQSKRGANKPSNLITLCSGHHQQLHEGKLAISGAAPHDITFAWTDDPHRITTRDRTDACPVGTSAATLEDVARAAQDALDEPRRCEPVPSEHERSSAVGIVPTGHERSWTFGIVPTGHELGGSCPLGTPR